MIENNSFSIKISYVPVTAIKQKGQRRKQAKNKKKGGDSLCIL
jgi:hypothetical protein